jgi:hypothetical protein
VKPRLTQVLRFVLGFLGRLGDLFSIISQVRFAERIIFPFGLRLIEGRELLSGHKLTRRNTNRADLNRQAIEGKENLGGSLTGTVCGGGSPKLRMYNSICANPFLPNRTALVF